MATNRTPDPHGRRRSPRPHRLATAAALLALSLAGCTTDPGDDPTTPPATPGEEPTSEPTESDTPDPVADELVEVYYLIDTRTGFRLAREPRDAPADSLARAAVEHMIAGPADSDYSTAWDPGTQVLDVRDEDGTVVVDLSEEARTANIGSEGAALMVQQLVWTATAEDPEAAVSLLIEGEPAGELWGAVSWDEPVTRADPLDVRMLVQIAEPGEGAVVSSPVTVTGDAAAFEANVPWKVTDTSGAEVLSGFTMTSEGQTFAPFSFEIELPPGTYSVMIVEDDPSDGEGGTPMSDSRTITVE